MVINIMEKPKHKATVIRTGTEDRLKFISGSNKDAARAAMLDMYKDNTIENKASIGFAYSNPDRLLRLNGLK